MSELRIEYHDPNELKPYENNARDHKDVDIEAIRESIREFGFNDPIGIWSDENLIVEGHGRQMAAIAEGLDSVPCIRLDHLTDEQRRAYALAHNKTAELSEWIFGKLNEELAGIQEIDMSAFGFEPIPEPEPEVAEDEVPEEAETRCKPGDLWKLGNHRLICGDSTDVNVIDRLMDGAKANMVYTDPPYGMGLNTDWSGAKSKLKFYTEKGCKGQGNTYEKVKGDNEDFDPALVSAIFASFDYCKEIFIWGADYYPELLKGYKQGNFIVWDKRSNDDTLEDYVKQSDKMYGSQFEICWSKTKHRKEIARVKWAGIFGTETEFDKSRCHPTQKPTRLAQWFLQKYSEVGDAIADIYGGSGSTLIACEQLNRKCYMAELDEYYCSVILQRYINFKGSDEDVFLLKDGKKIPYSEVE